MLGELYREQSVETCVACEGGRCDCDTHYYHNVENEEYYDDDDHKEWTCPGGTGGYSHPSPDAVAVPIKFLFIRSGCGPLFLDDFATTATLKCDDDDYDRGRYTAREYPRTLIVDDDSSFYRGETYDYVVLASFYCRDCWVQTQAGLTISYPPCPMPKLLEDAKKERLEEEAAELAADLEWERTKPEREAAALKVKAARTAEIKRRTEPYDLDAELDKLSLEEKAVNATNMAAYMERERQRKERWDTAYAMARLTRQTKLEEKAAALAKEAASAKQAALTKESATRANPGDWWDIALTKVNEEWAAKESTP